MKKKLCYLVIIAMFITSCCGCGNKNNATNEQEVQTEETSNKKDDDANEQELQEEATNETNNEMESNYEETTQHAHSYSKKITMPTCTAQGYTTYTCSCGDSYKSDYISAKGHIEVIDSAVKATTTSTGLTQGKHCCVCGAITVAQQSIPKKPSSTLIIEGVGETYNYWGTSNNVYSRVKIESAELSVKEWGDTEELIVTLIVSQVAGGDGRPLCWRYDVYDSNGICVYSGSCVQYDTTIGTKYQTSVSFYSQTPGTYTLKFKDCR